MKWQLSNCTSPIIVYPCLIQVFFVSLFSNYFITQKILYPCPKSRFLSNWLKMTKRNAFLSNIYFWIINISTERSESYFSSKNKKKKKSFYRLSIISPPENYLMVIVHFWRQLYGTYLTRNTKKRIYPSFPRKFEFSTLRIGCYCDQATWMYLNYNLKA